MTSAKSRTWKQFARGEDVACAEISRFGMSSFASACLGYSFHPAAGGYAGFGLGFAR